jgi:hypothetical protein
MTMRRIRGRGFVNWREFAVPDVPLEQLSHHSLRPLEHQEGVDPQQAEGRPGYLGQVFGDGGGRLKRGIGHRDRRSTGDHLTPSVDQHVFDPVGLCSVDECHDDVIAGGKRQHRRAVDPPGCPAAVDDHGEGGKPAREGACEGIEDPAVEAGQYGADDTTPYGTPASAPPYALRRTSMAISIAGIMVTQYSPHADSPGRIPDHSSPKIGTRGTSMAAAISVQSRQL